MEQDFSSGEVQQALDVVMDSETDTLLADSNTDSTEDWVPVSESSHSAPALGMRRQWHAGNGEPRAGRVNGPPPTNRPSATFLWPPG